MYVVISLLHQLSFYNTVCIIYKSAKLTKRNKKDVVKLENEFGSGFEVVLATGFDFEFVIIFVVVVLGASVVVIGEFKISVSGLGRASGLIETGITEPIERYSVQLSHVPSHFFLVSFPV